MSISPEGSEAQGPISSEKSEAQKKEELERQRRKTIGTLNSENINKLKAREFSWKDYKKSFEQAQKFGIIEQEDPDDILESEKDDILKIEKGVSKNTGIEKSVWRYIGPERKPGEKRTPERFLFDGLKRVLFGAAYGFEKRGEKREMADYIFGEILDKVEDEKKELDWNGFGEVLKRAEKFGGILEEIPKEEYGEILKDQGKQKEEIKKEIRFLRGKEKKLADQGEEDERKKVKDQEGEVKDKFETLFHPIKYITKWERGKPVEEKFYAFAGTSGERRRGSFKALVYDEISGPILSAAFETSRKKREKKAEEIKGRKEAERKKREQETKLVEEVLFRDLERLSRIHKKNPEKARIKAENMLKKESRFIRAKIMLSPDEYKALTEKGEIMPDDINSKDPSLIVGEPEEGDKVLEIRFDSGDIDLMPPYDEGKVHFKRPISKKNLVLK